MTKVNIGDAVKDEVSGFSGIATARAEYLHGVPKVLITPVNRECVIYPAEEWINEDRLIVIDKKSRKGIGFSIAEDSYGKEEID